MPENERQDTGRSMPQSDPHSAPWYTRLMRYFGGASHPRSAGDLIIDADDLDDYAEASALSKWWDRQFTLTSERKARYRIYDEMDTYDLVQMVLDVYAEEATQADYDKRRAVWIESKSKEMMKRGDECLRNCQMEDSLAPIARAMCKYGDRWQRLLYSGGKGVLGWQRAPAPSMSRIEDKYGRLVGFQETGKKFRNKSNEVSWPWDYVHFRLMGRYEEAGYGSSVLDALFRPWRQLILSEDSMLMYRLRRAADRNLVLIDVGDMEEHEALQWVNHWRKRFRKREFVDPASPSYKKQFNPLTPLEDIFMPSQEGQNTRIEQLSGSGNVGEIYDVDFYTNKFFGAAKVPKAYAGFEGDVNAKATLMQQDVRFARTIKRVQKALIYGTRTLLDIHYTLLAQDEGDQTYDFSKPEKAYIVQMSPISFLDEFERLELVRLRHEIVEAQSRLATEMNLDPRVWATYLLLHYAKLPEDLVLKLIAKTDVDAEKRAPGKNPFESEEAINRLKERFTEEQVGQILDIDKDQKNGIYELSLKEQVEVAHAVHKSASLRKIIGDIAFYHEDDIVEASLWQTDPSWLPITVKGRDLTDDLEAGKAREQLNEDLEKLKKRSTNQVND